MQVRIRYTAQLKLAAGGPTESVEVDEACSAAALVLRLADRHGDPLRTLLIHPEGQVRSTVLIFVGDEQVPSDSGAALKDGDLVTLMTPIAGG